MTHTNTPWMIGIDVKRDTISLSIPHVLFGAEEKRDEIFTEAGLRYIRIGMKGSDKHDTVDRRHVARRIIELAKKSGVKHFAISVSSFEKYIGPLDRMLIEFARANYEHVAHKTEPKDGWDFVEKITLIDDSIEWNEAMISAAILHGGILAQGLGLARDLANAPTNCMSPKGFVSRIIKETQSPDIGVEVIYLNERDLKTEKLEGILSVGKGSVNPPRLLILQYLQGPAEQKPILLVGKGIVYDDGGVNLKQDPTDMHMDKSGAAMVAAAIITAARLKIERNIIALIPLAENRASGHSYRQCDIITIGDKTVEIGNTDAEGRLVLADALVYGRRRWDPDYVITVATLTGAAHIALGGTCSALFVHDRPAGIRLAKGLIEIGEETGDRLWRLPLEKRHAAQIKGKHADLKNIGSLGRYGGAITAAAFLQQFVDEKVNWAHIDMAPRMTPIEGDHLAAGATGEPMCLLVALTEEL
ncbi:leucyl aminopeptidase family protein [Candidatus Kaiserbacteria bacterium]|nr:leucyl aminopeptidase family protein [Candidatus Kaiserbacteria bacterium]